MITLNISGAGEPPQKVVDSDGIPPGMNPNETGYIGMKGWIEFSGPFYAMNGLDVTFARQVVIITILRKVIVAQDTVNMNIYVIDRDKEISLGCQMKANLWVNGKVVGK